MDLLGRFAKCESGVTAIEYGLIVGFVSLVIATVALTFGDALRQTFLFISEQIPDVLSG